MINCSLTVIKFSLLKPPLSETWKGENTRENPLTLSIQLKPMSHQIRSILCGSTWQCCERVIPLCATDTLGILPSPSVFQFSSPPLQTPNNTVEKKAKKKSTLFPPDRSGFNRLESIAIPIMALVGRLFPPIIYSGTRHNRSCIHPCEIPWLKKEPPLALLFCIP